MKAALQTLLCLAMVFAVVAVTRAEDEKKADGKKTLKGELGCAKCVFKVKGIKACTNAIKVSEDGKDVVYIITDKGGKEKYHKEICTESKPGSVTGTVGKKGKQAIIKPAKNGVKFD